LAAGLKPLLALKLQQHSRWRQLWRQWKPHIKYNWQSCSRSSAELAAQLNAISENKNKK